MFRDRHPIAWAYHRSTSRWPFNMHGLNPQDFETPPFREDLDAESVVLADPAAPDARLETLLRERSSCRRFAPEPIDLDQLGSLLHWSYGVLGTTELGHEFCERPVPSGGGLYPLELSVLSQRVDGLDPGVYHYVPLGHRLEVVRGDVLPSMLTAELFLGQPYLIDAAAVIVISAVVERSFWKYEDRGYRYALLEAGHVAQNLVLCAQAFGLAALNLGGFLDEDLTALLALDADEEIVLYGTAVGQPQGDRRQRRFPPEGDEAFRQY